jgi:hypothetical protein
MLYRLWAKQYYLQETRNGTRWGLEHEQVAFQADSIEEIARVHLNVGYPPHIDFFPQYSTDGDTWSSDRDFLDQFWAVRGPLGKAARLASEAAEKVSPPT